MTRKQRIALFFVAFVFFLLLFVIVGGATQPRAASEPVCDKTLWKHVYTRARLAVHAPCVAVTGVIVDATAGERKDGVRHEADGDSHGWLKVDPQFASLLDEGNKSSEGGNLVFEIVCKFPVSQKDAKKACRHYTSPIEIPPIGSRVRITGSLVRDDNHEKWMEIHPVSSITVMK